MDTICVFWQTAVPIFLEILVSLVKMMGLTLRPGVPILGKGSRIFALAEGWRTPPLGSELLQAGGPI